MAKEVKYTKEGLRKYSSTDFVREDIMQKAKELAHLISTSEEVQTYQKAEKQISENQKIQQMIRDIKKKQKEVVAFESFENQEMVKKIEGEQASLQAELDALPIVQQFKQNQSDINYLLQLVVTIMKETLTEKINVESGTEGSELP